MQSETFGTLGDGREVTRHTLSNSQGLSISVINYGGIITHWMVPDRQGRAQDIALGFDSLEPYLGEHPYFGAIVGRVAGRISGGRFVIDGKEYALEQNQAPNHLHGGARGLDKRLWQVQPNPEDGAKLHLHYLSPDGEEGYPGNLDISVTYSVTEANEVVIEYRGQTDRPTPFSPTNHTYFNLAGESAGSIGDHTMQILADQYVPTDEAMTLSGTVHPVETGNDLRSPKPMAEIIPRLHRNHGHNYLNPGGKQPSPRKVARVHEPRSGRTMEVLTTEACLQFYTASHLDGSLTGKNGFAYPPHSAFCLECQGYPDGVSHPEIDDILLRPNQTYRQTTIHRFSVG